VSESKNLLELSDQEPVTHLQLQEILKPLLESTRIDRLCTAIEGLVEVNQALLAYMIDLDGGEPASQMGQSLDG